MDSVSVYRVADAECLPFADSSFDAVVTYNSLMDVEDMPAVVREASRVLTKDGSLAVCITHPLCDAGTFPDYSSGSPFVIEGSYRGKRPFAAVVERNGLVMDFGGGYAYDLESYARDIRGCWSPHRAYPRAGSGPGGWSEPTRSRARCPNSLLPDASPHQTLKCSAKAAAGGSGVG